MATRSFVSLHNSTVQRKTWRRQPNAMHETGRRQPNARPERRALVRQDGERSSAWRRQVERLALRDEPTFSAVSSCKVAMRSTSERPHRSMPGMLQASPVTGGCPSRDKTLQKHRRGRRVRQVGEGFVRAIKADLVIVDAPGAMAFGASIAVCDLALI